MVSAVDIIRSASGRRISVVGGGVSGLAAARLLQKLGARVLVSEKSTEPSPELAALGAHLELGGHTARIADADLVVTSPGVSADVLRLAGEAPVIGELELGYLLLPKTRLVAVTGTNGKTTTTALIGHMLQAAGLRIFVGGNIGTPLSSLSLSCLSEPVPDVVVIEASSFQCEGLVTLSADVAVYLNLTPDHLDRYASVEAYAAAKARLFLLQREGAVAVVNADDAVTSVTATRALKWRFSTASENAEAFLAAPEAGVALNRSYQLGNGVLRGVHNRQNQLAAILAARAVHVEPEAIQSALTSFPGVEHRIEPVRRRAGVSYFNDSKATNDDAAAKALLSFAEPVIWLAGGRDKRGGYAACVRAARGRVRCALLFGEAAPAIGSAMAGVCACEQVTNLDAAVARAAACAKPGDVVLLSPACSSYDQFKNYEQRGRAFKRLVNALPEAG